MSIACLIISSSLRQSSISRTLALQAAQMLPDCDVLDLRETDLPLCDGEDCYELEEVKALGARVARAQGILISTPIYNFDGNAAVKNLIELTGSAWSQKVVGFACAAGGASSYMSIMGLANSLMLDFRCLIVPRFVYATGEHVRDNEIVDEDLRERLRELTQSLHRLAIFIQQERD